MVSKSIAYTGSLPLSEEIMAASNAGIIDAVCEYAHTLGKQDWHYISYKLLAPYTHKCPICSNRPKGKRYGSNCICIPFACWHHGGQIQCRCNTHVINDSNWNRIAYLPDYEAALAIARRRIGVRDIMIIRDDPPVTALQKGDVCAHFSDGKYIHSSLYLGNGMMLDCSLERMHIAIRNAMDCKFAIRYTGGRNSLIYGDSGVAVEKVQAFLNRYFSDCEGWTPLAASGQFDRATQEAVMLFQFRNSIEADGIAGRETLAAMALCTRQSDDKEEQ